MIDYKEIAKRFEDRADIKGYYETRSFMKLKNELYFILQNETKQMLFLIGDPGIGKSVFLNNLNRFFPDMEVVKYNTPFFEPGDFVKTLIQKRDDSFEMTKEEATLLKPVEFIKTFLERKGEQVKEHSLEELIKQAISVNSKKSVLIAIDEAQLLNKEMIELIRILADSKAFWFLLAMHKHESKKILSEPQFRSRPHRVLELEPLSADEIRDFIVQELLKIGEYSLQEYFDNKLIKEIYKLTKGNFRDLKKLLHRMFLIMEQAKSLKRNGYDRVNSCLVTMAAIDGEILDI